MYESCQVNRFEDHALIKTQDYYYGWCGLDIEFHKHEDFYELFLLACGDFYHYYQGEETLISRNTMYFFKPGESHALRRALPQASHFTFLGTSKFFERFFAENYYLRNAFNDNTYLACELSDIEYDYVYKLANLLIHSPHEGHQVSLFLSNVISLMMFQNSTKPHEPVNEYVLDIIEKINVHSYLTVKVEDICRNYPLTRTTLLKKFKEYTGMTIIQYQKKQKLIRATQLLVNSQCTITEISEILGFDSFSHFLRIFKAEYKITPKEYRGEHSRQISH